MEKGINKINKVVAGAVFLAAVSGVGSDSTPVAGEMFAPALATAAPSFKCKAFSGSARQDCYTAKQRELQRMGAKQGSFKRSLRNCTRSYRNYRYEKPVWNKVRLYCITHGNPRRAPYLKQLSKIYKLRIPADCVRACGVAEGKTQYYTQWKNVCK